MQSMSNQHLVVFVMKTSEFFEEGSFMKQLHDWMQKAEHSTNEITVSQAHAEQLCKDQELIDHVIQMFGDGTKTGGFGAEPVLAIVGGELYSRVHGGGIPGLPAIKVRPAP